MKRILSLLLMFLFLAGCSSRAPSAPTAPPDSALGAELLLQNILPAAPEHSEQDLLEFVAADDIPLFLEIYGLSAAEVADCAIVRMGGARVFEIAVLSPADDSEEAVREAMGSYLLRRQGDFTGYAPDQALLAGQGAVLCQAPWVVLIISEDCGAVVEAFHACAGGAAVPSPTPSQEPSPEPAATGSPAPTATPTPGPSVPPSPVPTEEPAPEPSPEPSPEPTPEPSPEPTFELPPGWRKYTPPHTDDMTIYDTSAILSAWETGSTEGLTRKDKETYQRCREIIGQLIREDMSDYEKEWAIYSWMIRNVNYDWRQNDPSMTAPKDSFRPYGAIVLENAVCLGYATAFQLFMDLVGVECITVTGAAFASSGDHAWNMVRLNGQWYCVDATWDLGRGGSPQNCRYFNVTSDFMARTDHQWDYQNIPMATATDGGCP